MIEFNSPLYWVVSLASFAGLLAMMWFYVKICWLKWEPALKEEVARRFGVKLNYTIAFNWRIDKRSWNEYPGNRIALWLAVTLLNFAVILGLALLLLITLVVMGLGVVLLFRPPS